MSQYLLLVVTALGWVGAFVGLVAYAQVSRGKWAPDSLHFQLANLCATTLMCLVAAVNGVWPSMAANIAWMVIGAQALFVIARAHRRARAIRAAAPVDGPVEAHLETAPVTLDGVEVARVVLAPRPVVPVEVVPVEAALVEAAARVEVAPLAPVVDHVRAGVPALVR